jgi:hypothetical protein
MTDSHVTRAGAYLAAALSRRGIERNVRLVAGGLDTAASASPDRVAASLLTAWGKPPWKAGDCSIRYSRRNGGKYNAPERSALTNIYREIPMSENASGSNNNTLYFIVGGLVVVVAVMGYFYFGGHLVGHNAKIDLTIQAPKATTTTTP